MQDSSSTISFEIGDAQFALELADNGTAVALASMLPLQLTMSDLNGNEKYVYLSESLPASASNPGTIEAGDVMLFGDDCLVVFYKSHPTSYSYTRVGKIVDTTGLAATVGSSSIEARFAE